MTNLAAAYTIGEAADLFERLLAEAGLVPPLRMALMALPSCRQ